MPTVVDVYLDRPAILAELSQSPPSLIVNFGASDEAFAQVLFGDAEPQGQLPFDIPSSMEAVIQTGRTSRSTPRTPYTGSASA